MIPMNVKTAAASQPLAAQLKVCELLGRGNESTLRAEIQRTAAALAARVRPAGGLLFEFSIAIDGRWHRGPHAVETLRELDALVTAMLTDAVTTDGDSGLPHVSRVVVAVRPLAVR